ncbi:unnamed protein product [Adineta steineri]|uniref:Uncharacterized protein n=1 Tax=Adineta steineri TaxID=433720 RepID=A0A815NPZ4_9BILA|nr:unnamed protein product [Adineta steineri]CAF4019086.1 unnamed protein product [Adineta steineri]
MLNQKLLSTEDLSKRSLHSHVHVSVSRVATPARLSHHQSVPYECKPSTNGKSRIIIHRTIRSPYSKSRSIQNKVINSNVDVCSISTILPARGRQNTVNHPDVSIGSTEQDIMTTSISTTLTTTTETTTTSATCTTPTSTALSYNTTTSVYTLATYNYTASYTGFVVLEFGFKGQTGSEYWYLDDVSLVDTNTFNSEMLVNGNFENGTTNGWQLLCTSNCQSAAGVIAYNTSCYAGLFCYTDGCKSGFDFLRQAFSTTIGHVYTLSFWIRTDTKPQQYAFVRFF